MNTSHPCVSGVLRIAELGREIPTRPPLLVRLVDLVLTWQDRARERRELGRLTDRDLNDIGLSRAEITREAAKPFWHA
jgi:uncharacterized protein YjiS (DUF1127 family)